ncbi:MAG: CocE/NonD family hydrolase [Cyanobacteria bacterium REEB459]|nr:CocE/NonD family hydrolase [Cyanobacteria bacterium REEB459]
MGPYPVESKQLIGLTLPQGIRLEADVYYPQGQGPFPVLLMRQPYGRAIASTVVYAHPRWYASHGYIVVIQDVRGRGSSGGDFKLFEHEAEDGYASVLWAAQLPRSTGDVGMYGFSYQGMTQLYAASRRPAPLRAIAPAMVGYDLYADWAYENGALLLQQGLGWALQLAAETARRRGQVSSYQRLYQAAHQLPLQEPIPASPQVLRELAPDSFFHDWLNHPQDDPYWHQLKPALDQVDLPMLHIGGWFDPYLRGDLRLYQKMVAQSHQPQPLWVGPWGHLPWSRQAGARDFGAEADSPMDRLQLRWFDQFLKGKPGNLESPTAVHLFEMGSNRWQTFDHWPQSEPLCLYLSSTGLAALNQQDGQLSTVLAADHSQGDDTLVHDPWRPVPSLGGHGGVPSGVFDRAAIDARTDVLTYTTASLTSCLRVTGEISLELYCHSDRPSFDISAVVSEIDLEGRVLNLTQGYGRVHQSPGPGPWPLQQRRLALQPSCFVVAAGHALRLSLAAACFPAYAVNSGLNQGLHHRGQIDYQITTLRVVHGSAHPSCLKLGQTIP